MIPLDFHRLAAAELSAVDERYAKQDRDLADRFLRTTRATLFFVIPREPPMSETLTADQVRKVAKLARLQLSEADVDRFTQQLGQVLGYVEMLGELNTDGVAPLAHPLEIKNVLREDVPTPSLPREAALSNAPKSDGKCFLVPQILDAG